MWQWLAKQKWMGAAAEQEISAKQNTGAEQAAQGGGRDGAVRKDRVHDCQGTMGIPDHGRQNENENFQTMTNRGDS